MRPFRPVPVVVLAILSFLPVRAGMERIFRFKMYRNPPKDRLVILPVQGNHLAPPARDNFRQILVKEAAGLRSVKLTDPPVDYFLDLQYADSLPPPLDPLSREGIDLVLIPKLDFSAGNYSFYAEILSTRDGTIRASYREDCRCPIGEVIFWILPECMRRLEKSLSTPRPQCGKNMAYIDPPRNGRLAAAEGTVGAAKTRPKPFCIDLFEFPNAYGEQPLIEKDYEQASALCSSQGKRLCLEPEWEFACAGTAGRAYPYGTAYNPGACNTGTRTIQTAGENGLCRSRQGVFDLSGNVYEWTASTWGEGFTDRVVRGGNWEAGADHSTCGVRFAQPPDSASKAIGFRCCSSLDR